MMTSEEVKSRYSSKFSFSQNAVEWKYIRLKNELVELLIQSFPWIMFAVSFVLFPYIKSIENTISEEHFALLITILIGNMVISYSYSQRVDKNLKYKVAKLLKLEPFLAFGKKGFYFEGYSYIWEDFELEKEHFLDYLQQMEFYQKTSGNVSTVSFEPKIPLEFRVKGEAKALDLKNRQEIDEMIYSLLYYYFLLQKNDMLFSE